MGRRPRAQLPSGVVRAVAVSGQPHRSSGAFGAGPPVPAGPACGGAPDRRKGRGSSCVAAPVAVATDSSSASKALILSSVRRSSTMRPARALSANSMRMSSRSGASAPGCGVVVVSRIGCVATATSASASSASAGLSGACSLSVPSRYQPGEPDGLHTRTAGNSIGMAQDARTCSGCMCMAT